MICWFDKEWTGGTAWNMHMALKHAEAGAHQEQVPDNDEVATCVTERSQRRFSEAIFFKSLSG